MNRDSLKSFRMPQPLFGWIPIGILIVFGIGLTAVAEDPAISTVVSLPDDSMANQFARDVFSGDEFWWKRKSDVKSVSFVGQFFSFIYDQVIRPLFRAISDTISWLWRTIFSGVKLPSGDWSRGIPFLWTIIIFMILLVAGRLIFVFRHTSVARNATVAPPSVDLLPQADQLLSQAQVALARGDHRAAIRLAFLSFLSWLQDRGLLKYDPARSNREYQRDLHSSPELAASFRASAEPFECCWYGGRELNADQVRNVISLCQKHFQVAKGSE